MPVLLFVLDGLAVGTSLHQNREPHTRRHDQAPAPRLQPRGPRRDDALRRRGPGHRPVGGLGGVGRGAAARHGRRRGDDGRGLGWRGSIGAADEEALAGGAATGGIIMGGDLGADDMAGGAAAGGAMLDFAGVLLRAAASSLAGAGARTT
ncbi:hypothetical protein PG997_006429 [Apiospora hydei]|uniref:Uncharacterized protein n=1 Tax=Apiospora hydei TaxID=1337664 RepID=A0ABR1WRW7_9PEZI